MSRMFDSVKVRGFLGIKVKDLNGNVIRNIQIPNTVCRGARAALEALCLQQNAGEEDYNKVWSIWAGDDNTAPANTQLTLVSAPANWFRKAVDPAQTVYDVGGVEGLFEVVMTMEAAEGTIGRQYCECGLFARGDDDDPTAVDPWAGGAVATEAKMFARQIHPIIEKDGAISIEYTWRFQFTI